MRWVRRIGIALAAAIAILVAALVIVDTPVGHRWVTERIAAIRMENGLRFTVGRVDGSLYGRARLRDVRVYDPEGLVFAAPAATLDWSPWRWFAGTLDITALDVPQATLAKPPRTRPTPPGPLLPDFDIRIGRLAIDRLRIAPSVTGVARSGSLVARADIRAGRALLDIDAVVQGSDRLRLRIDAEPDRDRFDIAVVARGAADGLLARATGIRRPLAIDVTGDGRWASWNGTATAIAGGARIADLRLAARAGTYTLTGEIVPRGIVGGRLARLTAPRLLVQGGATFERRRLAGTLALRSAALALEATGGIDLAAGAFRELRLTGRLLRPSALFDNMTGREIGVRAILDGPFAIARFEYRLAADRVAFDNDGFEQVRAAGRGRLSAAPLRVPLRLTAARVTGSGDVAGGILRNLVVDGVLRIGNGLVVGEKLRLASDKLAGRIDLRFDLATGRYQVALAGTLARYLIPGIGVVDVSSSLRLVPGPGGRGARLAGQGIAEVRRLDNAFFRSLAGGLPRITTGLERSADKVLHFTNIVLTAPSLRLTGTGYRRQDKTFRFELSGRQARYGPVTLVLDGRIERPRIELRLARPNAALGLAAVRATLDPTPQGYRFVAAGGSRLGAFTSEGAILLPSGGDAAIAIARLDVAGTRAAGTLGIVTGGFQGRLAVTGGGLDGALDFRPAGDIQRIEAHLAARNATLDGTRVRRARVDAVVLLDPAGLSVEATASGTGLARGGLTLARFAGTARLRGGAGEVRAAIAGSRGRGFDLTTVAQFSGESVRVAAQGTVDRRPIALTAPAVIVRDGDGWRLQPARLAFAGGTASVSGRFSGAASAIDLTLERMPLSVLDIGFPGLGLAGTASGTLAYAQGGDAAPSGRANLTVRGLSRSGLVQTSQPIDVGVAAVLSPGRAAIRAVAGSRGATVGRLQALLTPGAGGSLLQAPGDAQLFAQLRYVGPADTLWRLTGVELFDLSGPVSIGADVTGAVARPVIRGVVRASGARIESATTGTVLSGIEASGRFAGSRLAIDRFAAAAGRDGRVTGTGAFEFAAADGIGLDLRLQAERAVMIDRDDIAATVTGPLSFRSSGRGGVIAGDVVLDRSRYRLGRATATTAIPRLDIREINLPDGDGAEDDAPTAPWRLDIRARAPGQLAVNGLGLRSEWSADLRIGGAPASPAITGRATLIRGDYEFAGREFDLERGIIRFDGEVPANPALDIEANADSTGLNASIRVTGVAQRPEITFASVPALPQDELLSRLLFGTSITNLSAPEALQLAAAVAALQDGGNGLNPINAVRRAAGLDRLRILPADPQTGQGTSVAAGKYVTRRLYAEIVTDGQGYSATRVEFQVTRWLSLLSSISTLGRQSANVRVSRDY